MCVYIYINTHICIFSNKNIRIHAYTLSLCTLTRKMSFKQRSKKSRKALKMQKHTGYQRCVKEKQFSVPLHAFKSSLRDSNRFIQGY